MQTSFFNVEIVKFNLEIIEGCFKRKFRHSLLCLKTPDTLPPLAGPTSGDPTPKDPTQRNYTSIEYKGKEQFMAFEKQRYPIKAPLETEFHC
jgi:hypothetical protein